MGQTALERGTCAVAAPKDTIQTRRLGNRYEARRCVVLRSFAAKSRPETVCRICAGASLHEQASDERTFSRLKSQAEELLRHGLAERFPAYRWSDAEFDASLQKQPEYSTPYWICNAIDGAVHFCKACRCGPSLSASSATVRRPFPLCTTLAGMRCLLPLQDRALF